MSRLERHAGERLRWSPPDRAKSVSLELVHQGAHDARSRAADRGTDVIRVSLGRMTMLSFRMPDDDAAELQRWAQTLGVDRSAILREALHRHLVQLSGESDAEKWAEEPLTVVESSLSGIADWGPAEDWQDWADAEG